MKIKYDQKADAAYIQLNNKKPYQASRKITDNVLVDYAQDGSVVGIEVLAASVSMPLSRVAQVAVERV
jgi:uncharacterized protein YuzE